MKSRSANWICAFLTVVFATPAFPAGAQPRAINGSAFMSCGTWSADQDPKKRSARLGDKNWLAGFMSRATYAHPALNMLRYVDLEAQTRWVDNYCATHPLDSVVAAGFELERELVRRAKSVAPSQTAPTIPNQQAP